MRLAYLVSFPVTVLVCAATWGAPATPPAGSTVTAVQSPAWLVQAHAVKPLAPGARLAGGDQLRTGSGGRVYIALPEHSTVKMGESTELAMPAMQMMHDNQGGMFKASLRILTGVFRFTTSLIGKTEHRQVDIRVGVATIGIRGTDVWGRAGGNGDLVALLEGKAEMHVPGHAMMMMDQPMHYMMMPKNGGMEMNVPITQAKLADWAAQTDVHTGDGVLQTGGRWVVALISSADERITAHLMQELASAGYPSADIRIMKEGRAWHRLEIHQVASYRDAHALAKRLGKAYPLTSPQVFRTH